jgi:hypothetical protein
VTSIRLSLPSTARRGAMELSNAKRAGRAAIQSANTQKLHRVGVFGTQRGRPVQTSGCQTRAQHQLAG